MPDNPSSMTPLPGGTAPPTQISAPAAPGSGPPTNASPPPAGYPPWLLQFVRGGWVRYNLNDSSKNDSSKKGIGDCPEIEDPSGKINPITKKPAMIADPEYASLKTGAVATGPDDAPSAPAGNLRTNTTVRLYQLKYLFGVLQAIPGPSGVNAVTFLLLVEAQKALWTALISFLAKAVADATAAANEPLAKALASLQQPGELDGLPALTQPVTDADNKTTYSNSEITVCVAEMMQQAVTDVPAHIAQLTPAAQRSLMRDYCGVHVPVGGCHDRGYFSPHAGGGAMDIEYFGSPWIPLKGTDTPTPRFYGDAPKSVDPGTAQSVIYDPCLAVWNRACNFLVGHDTTAKCPHTVASATQDTTDVGLTTTTVDAIWELDASVRQYFAQAGNTQVEADRKTVGPGMVIGSSVYDSTSKTFSGNYTRATYLGSAKPPSPYSGGIIG